MWDGNHWWTGCNIIIIIIRSLHTMQNRSTAGGWTKVRQLSQMQSNY
jgi:hypothetical protein